MRTLLVSSSIHATEPCESIAIATEMVRIARAIVISKSVNPFLLRESSECWPFFGNPDKLSVGFGFGRDFYFSAEWFYD